MGSVSGQSHSINRSAGTRAPRMVSNIANSRRSWRERQMFAGSATPLCTNVSEPNSEMRNSSDIHSILCASSQLLHLMMQCSMSIPFLVLRREDGLFFEALRVASLQGAFPDPQPMAAERDRDGSKQRVDLRDGAQQ